MARAFASASSQYFTGTHAPVSAFPFTVSLWAKSSTTSGVQSLFSFGNAGQSNRLILYQSKAQIQSFGGPDVRVAAAVNYSTTAWFNVIGEWASDTSRTVYYNGGNSGTTATSRAIGTVTTLQIGNTTSINEYMNGSIAEVGMWNVTLTDAEKVSLAAGVSPLMVRPKSLVGYWPLFARATNEESWAGAPYILTNTNTATATAHPSRMIYPTRRKIILPAAAGGGGTTIPVFMHHYTQQRAA